MRIGPPRVERRDGRQRVVAEVDGEPLWLESADAALEPAPEALASMVLLPALGAGRPVASAAPLDPRWSAGVERLLAVTAKWWDLPRRPPSAPAALADAPGHERGTSPGRGRTALFMSCGGDSFYTLLRGPDPVDLLVFLDGFDIRLDEASRARAAEASVRAVAEATGRRAVSVRTNVRDHHLTGAADWERCHGGVLAGAAHALGPEATRFLVSSSYSRRRDIPWGSHWRLDSLWSGERVLVVHTGDRVERETKLRWIAGEPLVQRHLRVCWEHRSPALNCGICEKCVRTLISLVPAGPLERFAGFDQGPPLEQRVRALGPVNTGIAEVYATLRGRGVGPGVDRAIAELIERSGGVRPLRQRLADRLKAALPASA